jgi:hypothetical protein
VPLQAAESRCQLESTVDFANADGLLEPILLHRLGQRSDVAEEPTRWPARQIDTLYGDLSKFGQWYNL